VLKSGSVSVLLYLCDSDLAYIPSLPLDRGGVRAVGKEGVRVALVSSSASSVEGKEDDVVTMVLDDG